MSAARRTSHRMLVPTIPFILAGAMSFATAAAQGPQALPEHNACVFPNGPPPCKDRDGDGLCDSWEIAGHLPGGAPLPDADPDKPDIFVQYDWLGYGLNDLACHADADCAALGASHRDETCVGPPVPGQSSRSCVRSCTADVECTSRGPSHVGDRCVQGLCQHTHDPEVIAPGALQMVVDSFAAHGINLHVVRGHELPHSHVVSFRPLNQLSDDCEGGSVASASAGAGQYAESFYDLKSRSFDPRLDAAFHYSLFAHYSSCDSTSHCDTLTTTGTCPTVKGSRPQIGQSGQAVINGNDLMISLGHFIDDLGGVPDIFNVGGTFMHELGHNLGLHHGGGVSSAASSCLAPDCENLPLFKPNYLSVMNYRYQFSGILQGETIGSSTPRSCSSDLDCNGGAHCLRRGTIAICSRLDYSSQILPVGGNTPGALTESGQLNEMAGLGSGTADLFSFDDGSCSFRPFTPTQGPVDWDGDGIAGDNPAATADLNTNDHPLQACTVTNQVLRGHADWGSAPGQSIFNYKFQCNPANFADGGPASEPMRELTPEMAAQAHALHPPRQARALSCANSKPGRTTLALLGEDDLSVSEILVSSLALHNAKALRAEVRDVDSDGIPDLLVEFDAKMNLGAETLRLTGWLENSQVIFALVSMSPASAVCPVWP